MRLFLIAILAAGLAVASCGKKGEPQRPGTKQEEKTDVPRGS